VAVLGLSFKSDTDDLRESPNVELAERLIGKGFHVRIYDPIVNPARLMGANLRHVASRLPHLNRLLESSADEALADAEVVVVSCADDAVVAALTAAKPPMLIDLHGRLGRVIERLPGYQGAAW
jgi:GDP-mannose 6-dehydrogenase